MPTYLLTWNPLKWRWSTLQEDVEEVRAVGFLTDTWSCGISKLPVKGDRFFMLRQGLEPRGIFGSGVIESGVKEKGHWDKEKSKAGKKARYVEIKWEVLLNPENEEIFPRAWLDGKEFAPMYWNTQMSGIRMPDGVARELESRWSEFLRRKQGGRDLYDFMLPDEVDESEVYFEGATKKVVVNIYERNPEARRKCLEHYGFDCYVCDFNFERVYGEVGRNFIHVHYLRPLAEVGEEYRLDPVKDLRPICPNCHAIIHRKSPPYSIEEMKKILSID